MQPESSEQSPACVLVQPQLGENTGAAARAMRNFGLNRLLLVDPRDGWPNPSAVAMASGAGKILESAGVFEDLGSAVARQHYVLATTARSRDLSKPVMAPAAAMDDARARIAEGQRVAVLFGPERAGLNNHDLVLANAIIEVPADPAFKSLNVSQCVLIVAYEWVLSGLRSVRNGAGAEAQDPETAVQEEKSVLYEKFAEDLSKAGYFRPEEKEASMRMNLRNLLLRHEFSKAEVRTLHGIRNALRRFQAIDDEGAGSDLKDVG